MHSSQGADLFSDLADQYAASHEIHLEALCRYQRAQCLNAGRASTEAERHEVQKERAAEYERAAELFDGVGDVRQAGRAWYHAAYEYNWLGLVLPDYREKCFATCNIAAARFEVSGDWWGKGLAESLAGQTLRQNSVGSPSDLRNLPSLQLAVDSFRRADRPLEAAGALMTVAVEQSRSASPDEWMPTAVGALHAYEDARPGLQMPHDREQWDRTIIANGVRPLASKVRRVAGEVSDHPLWDELIWLLIEAPKARSFQDQHLQDEAWNSLVTFDTELSTAIKTKEQAELGKARLERNIGALLVSGLPEEDIDATDQELRGHEESLKEAQRKIKVRIEELARENPERTELVSTAPVSLSELQGFLNAGEAYLTYRWNGGAPLRALLTSTHYSSELAKGAFSTFVRQAAAEALEGVVLSDIDPDLTAALVGRIPDGIHTLIISPDSLLLGLPWHQLPAPTPSDPNALLGDRYTLAITPAGGVLRHLRSEFCKHAPVQRDATYMGVSCKGDRQKPLHFADLEVANIKEDYFASDSASISLMTEECHRFLDTGCNVGLLHLACHAERHGILLSQDGCWTTPVDLLKRQGRSFGADILLLTGCFAGDFSREESNEFLGIIRQLMVVTGARAAVTSVAPAVDAAGPLFADMLLSALTGTKLHRPWPAPDGPMAVGRAVAWTKQTMRKLYPVPESVKDLIDGFPALPWHPAWWSPWLVVGDPSARLYGDDSPEPK
ncbi:CHAT domain-containing protein [Streptomyces mirabilis]|uniref:CHAT domain-containing protein n=1 Tax=Streptomyces mirabilis TaxID=68239 RepID=UPI003712AB3D